MREVCDLCAGGPDVIRKEAWPFYRTISGVRLCWELDEPEAPERSQAACQEDVFCMLLSMYFLLTHNLSSAVMLPNIGGSHYIGVHNQNTGLTRR